MHGTWLLILSLLVLFPTAGLARIGETLQECVQRYGQPIEPEAKGPIFIFRKGEFVVGVEIYENKASMIFYQKAKRDILNKPAPLSDNEVELLMKINGGDRKWQKRNVISIAKEWETEDGALFSQHDSIAHNFSISTKEHIERAAAKKKAQEKQAIQGL